MSEFTGFTSSLSCETVRYSRCAGSLPRMQRKSSGSPGLFRIPFADGAHFLGGGGKAIQMRCNWCFRCSVSC